MKRFRLPLAVAFVFVTTLSACRGKNETPSKDGAQQVDNPTAEQAPLKIDACELFPIDLASEIAGENVSWMSSTLEDAVGRDPLNCSYNAGSSENPRILSLIARPGPSPERAQRMHKSTRAAFETMARGDVREIPNLGESAFWAGGDIQQLRVLSGSHEFAVTVNLGSGTDGSAAAQKIAKNALDQLRAVPRDAARNPAQDQVPQAP